VEVAPPYSLSLTDDCATRGASGCIQKPFDIDEFVAEVQRVFKSVSNQAALAMC
jgi:hypothetical protein